MKAHSFEPAGWACFQPTVAKGELDVRQVRDGRHNSAGGPVMCLPADVEIHNGSTIDRRSRTD